MDPVLCVDILSMEKTKITQINPPPPRHPHPTTTTILGRHQLILILTNQPTHGRFRISSVSAVEGIHVGIQEQVGVGVVRDNQDQMRCLQKKTLIRC
jgi:hypothetical protein